MSTSNELRVFISSTFRDLQEEREHLVKKIFPEIRALCRQRGVTFTEVDLRWGLTDEDVALGRIIRTCLEEIDRCRPYFFGITGERYGYVPEYVDIQKDPELIARYPWIEDAVLEGSSIIDMEFRHAALNSTQETGERSGPHFFFRRQREQLEDAGDSIEVKHLDGLKDRVRTANLPIDEFRDAGSLGEMIYDELVRILKRDFADARPPTPLEEERSRHSAFSHSRRRAYIASPQYILKLNAFAEGSGVMEKPTPTPHSSVDANESNQPVPTELSVPLVIYAESGSGKSSLLAYWAEQFRRRHPDALVVEHYVGIGAVDVDHLGVIRHVMMELKEHYQIPQEIPQRPEELESEFANWLAFRPGDNGTGGESSPTLVLIIDGVNQLTGSGLSLSWIPEFIPSHVRLIVSSTVEETLVQLRSRGWHQIGMQPLAEKEREAVIVRFLSEFHKALSVNQIARIAADQKSSHPLFLRTLLEEIRLQATHDLLDRTIDYYLSATGTEDLFQFVLERMEDDFGTKTVRDVMSLLWASRFGLSEIELGELTGISRLKLSTLILGLDFHLVRRVGLLTFFHDYLRRATRKRYLPDGQKEVDVHRQLAEYFSTQEAGLRTSRELIWQMRRTGDHDGLIRALSDIDHLSTLWEAENKFEVLSAWAELGEAADPEKAYHEGYERWCTGAPDSAAKCMALGHISELMESTARFDAALEWQRRRLQAAIDCRDRVQEAKGRMRLGYQLYLLYQDDEAIEYLTAAKELCTELGLRADLGYTLGNLGNIYERRGDLDNAYTCHLQQQEFCHEVGDKKGVANALHNRGMIHVKRGEWEKTLGCFRQAEAIRIAIGDQMGLNGEYQVLGVLYTERGEIEKGAEYLDKSISIAQRSGNPYLHAMSLATSGTMLGSMGDLDRAATQLNDALELLSVDTPAFAPLRANIEASLARVHDAREDYENALACACRALDTARESTAKHAIAWSMVAVTHCLLDLVDACGDQDVPEYVRAYLPETNHDSLRQSVLSWGSALVEEAGHQGDSDPRLRPQLKFYAARIDAMNGNLDASIQQLENILAEASTDDDHSLAYYLLWKTHRLRPESDPATIDFHRTEALRYCSALLAVKPDYDATSRMNELNAN